MFDGIIGQFYFKEDPANRQFNLLLFPRSRKDDGRTIEVIVVETVIGKELEKLELTSAEVNGLLFPKKVKEQQSTSLFVERRRHAR